MTKCHAVSPFDYLDLTNGIVPFMTLLSTCDIYTNNQHQWYYMIQEGYVAHCFSCLNPMNTKVLLTIPLTSDDADACAKCHMTESCISF